MLVAAGCAIGLNADECSIENQFKKLRATSNRIATTPREICSSVRARSCRWLVKPASQFYCVAVFLALPHRRGFFSCVSEVKLLQQTLMPATYIYPVGVLVFLLITECNAGSVPKQ